eukprot:scaffold48207_cov49-Prasinocladus_malaysianus.AAC.1
MKVRSSIIYRRQRTRTRSQTAAGRWTLHNIQQPPYSYSDHARAKCVRKYGSARLRISYELELGVRPASVLMNLSTSTTPRC